MSLYKLIVNGQNRDYSVYDCDSMLENRLTKRLLCLMIFSAKRVGFKPTKFYIDTIQIPEIMGHMPPSVEWPDIGPIYFHGIEVCFVNGLDKTADTQEFLTFYKNMGGAGPYKKDSLIVIASDKEAVLGHY